MTMMIEVILLVGLTAVREALEAVALVAAARAVLEAVGREDMVLVEILKEVDQVVVRRIPLLADVLRRGWMTRCGCCWSGWSRRRRIALRG